MGHDQRIKHDYCAYTCVLIITNMCYNNYCQIKVKVNHIVRTGEFPLFSLFLVYGAGRQKVTGGGYKELQGSALKLILSQGIQAWRT